MSDKDRHSKTEVERRVSECFKLRYESTPSIKQEEWVQYCHENYGDRSEQQYCDYWASAKAKYDTGWKEKLNSLLGPATERIEQLLASDNTNDHKEAIKMVYKYTGNDIERQEIKSESVIKVSFTSDGD
jgi:hypothetical protein